MYVCVFILSESQQIRLHLLLIVDRPGPVPNIAVADPVLIVNSKRKQSRKTSRSGSDVLTFTNPNYNGVDGLCHHHPGEASSSSSARNTIWKRLKYDRAQVGFIFSFVDAIVWKCR